MATWRLQGTLPRLSLAEREMDEAKGSGSARRRRAGRRLGLALSVPGFLGADQPPPCSCLAARGPERCAAVEGSATQGQNRRRGLFVRHRNQQGKKSPRSGRDRTGKNSTGRGSGDWGLRGGRAEGFGGMAERREEEEGSDEEEQWRNAPGVFGVGEGRPRKFVGWLLRRRIARRLAAFHEGRPDRIRTTVCAAARVRRERSIYRAPWAGPRRLGGRGRCMGTWRSQGTLPRLSLAEREMDEAKGSGSARRRRAGRRLGLALSVPGFLGADQPPPCSCLAARGPERCAAVEGSATQGQNRRRGLFVRHRNQQGKKSSSPSGRTGRERENGDPAGVRGGGREEQGQRGEGSGLRGWVVCCFCFGNQKKEDGVRMGFGWVARSPF